MRIFVTFDLPESEDYTAEDVTESIKARLDEIYPSDDGGVAVPENVRVSIPSSDAVTRLLLDAANVGLEGLDDADPVADEAWGIVDHLRG